MRCRGVRRYLGAYVDGEVASDRREAIKAHLDGCKACRAELESLKSSIELVEGLPQIEPSEGFEAAFWRRVRAMEHEAQSGSSWLQRFLGAPYLRPALATAGALVLAVGVYVKVSPMTGAPSEGEIRIAMDLDLLRNLDLIENIELLEDMDVILGLDVPQS